MTATILLRAAKQQMPPRVGSTRAYTQMIHFCASAVSAASEIEGRFLGDELAVRPQLMAALYGSRFGLVATAARAAHPGSPPAARAAAMARSAVGGLAELRRLAASHCEVAELLGARMGLTEQVQAALRHLYERWDGKGLPGDLRGERVPLPVRVMQVAQDADVAWQRGGPVLARRTVRGRAGSGLDPQVAAVFLSLGDQVYAGVDASSVWEEALAAEPGPRPVIGEGQMDACLSAMADFADLKSMCTVGHPGCRRPGRDGSRGRRAGRGRGGRTAPGGAGARPRPGGRPCPGVGQAGPADPRRTRAGAAARLSQRAGPGHRSGLALIARGMATKQAARQLGISVKTCDHHVQRMYRKLGVSTRAGATLFAVEHGLLDRD